MEFVVESPFFGVVLSVFAYKIGLMAARKAPSPVTNPLLIAILLIIAFLRIFDVSLSDYDKGGSLLTLTLSPPSFSRESWGPFLLLC
ncbi:MAG: LrgB family protein [Synergistaceae bacterium]|jgi:putative effector of murein hydrolase|nr:LrgB family protein [Synergistaceae bacterium]